MAHGSSNPPGDYDYMRLITGIQKDFPRTVFHELELEMEPCTNTNTTELLNHPGS